MVFAAVKPNSEALEVHPVDDPGPSQITVKAGGTLTGEIDLQDVIKRLAALKKSDVLLFWAYKNTRRAIPSALDWRFGDHPETKVAGEMPSVLEKSPLDSFTSSRTVAVS